MSDDELWFSVYQRAYDQLGPMFIGEPETLDQLRERVRNAAAVATEAAAGGAKV